MAAGLFSLGLGSVRSINSSIDITSWQAQGTPAGGESVSFHDG